MNSELHEIPPRQRLLDLQKALNRVRSLKTLRSRVSEYLHCGGSEIKDFHYKINNHDWKGCIYLKRNNLMGSIFSLFDNRVLIIRGFPKIKYSHQSKALDKYVIAEEKVDGTNLGVWVFPDGSIMGKTRMRERWDLSSSRAGIDKTWKAKFEQTEGYNRVYDLAKEGYLVFVELYGYKNQGEFVKYSVPLSFKVIGIVDRKTFTFLSRPTIEVLCERFKLPLPDIHYKGLLTQKQIERLEFELDSFIRLDGMEGLVAKYWNPNDQDSHFCKLKCEKVKERCYKISHSLIPSPTIRKAIKKALDEHLGETKLKKLLPFVLEELREEFDESLIEPSKEKIESLLRYKLTPSDKELKEKILEGMKELKKSGVNIEDPRYKGEVLSGLHDRLEDINPSTLFKIYREILEDFKVSKDD